MILPKDNQLLVIYTARKNVGHQPFKKVIGQNFEFYTKF
jgi:hypothetical protein